MSKKTPAARSRRRAVLVLDASVLINLLRVDRADLLGRHPCRFLVTEHVVAEVTEVYPEQLSRFNAALQKGFVVEVAVDAPAALAEFARLKGQEPLLGDGECSAMAAASVDGHGIAIDDRKAIAVATRFYPAMPVHRTQDVMAEAIRAGALTVAQADSIKLDWEQNHRFRLKIKSFAELI